MLVTVMLTTSDSLLTILTGVGTLDVTSDISKLDHLSSGVKCLKKVTIAAVGTPLDLLVLKICHDRI